MNIPTASCLSTLTCGAQSTMIPLPLSSTFLTNSGSIFPCNAAVAQTKGIWGETLRKKVTRVVMSEGRVVGQKFVPKLTCAHRSTHKIAGR